MFDLHRVIVPYKNHGFGTDLTCGAVFAGRINSETEDIVVVLNDKALLVCLLVQNYAHSSCVVDDFSCCCVS